MVIVETTDEGNTILWWSRCSLTTLSLYRIVDSQLYNTHLFCIPQKEKPINSIKRRESKEYSKDTECFPYHTLPSRPYIEYLWCAEEDSPWT